MDPGVFPHLKILEARLCAWMVYCVHPRWRGRDQEDHMSENTCAACDYPLDQNAIKITVGGRTVEVCCDDCARKLKEAHATAATAARKG